jgi:hypothetical protein
LGHVEAAFNTGIAGTVAEILWSNAREGLHGNAPGVASLGHVEAAFNTGIAGTVAEILWSNAREGWHGKSEKVGEKLRRSCELELEIVNEDRGKAYLNENHFLCDSDYLGRKV